jgi:tryptophan-rich sensory protein
MPTLPSWLGLIAWLAVCFATALFGAQFAPDNWYEQLAKPSWTPPDGWFPPVWTVLYTLMGIAAWLIWKQKGFAGALLPLTLFAIQLLLNALWPWLFFGRHAIALAFADIVLLWMAIVATLITFWHHRPSAGLLLLPYLLWVSFAAVLNLAIWQLNP